VDMVRQGMKSNCGIASHKFASHVGRLATSHIRWLPCVCGTFCHVRYKVLCIWSVLYLPLISRVKPGEIAPDDFP